MGPADADEGVKTPLETSPAPAEPPPAAPANRVYEWLAALVIMVFLGLVLMTFLSFLKGLRD